MKLSCFFNDAVCIVIFGNLIISGGAVIWLFCHSQHDDGFTQWLCSPRKGWCSRVWYQEPWLLLQNQWWISSAILAVAVDNPNGASTASKWSSPISSAVVELLLGYSEGWKLPDYFNHASASLSFGYGSVTSSNSSQCSTALNTQWLRPMTPQPGVDCASQFCYRELRLLQPSRFQSAQQISPIEIDIRMQSGLDATFASFL